MTMRVLVADDAPDVAEVVAFGAQMCWPGCQVSIATNGDEALELFEKAYPNLVVLDIEMPKRDGFEVCKRLRADPATRDTFVLMITALDQPSDIDRAVDAGTNDFLTKPINKTELLLRVKSGLESRRHKEQLAQAIAYIEGVEQGKP